MDKKEYLKTFTEDDLPGYYAITEAAKSIYGEQEPTHWACMDSLALGGDNPVWAIDCFESTEQAPHFHYMTSGISNIYYDEDAAGGEISGFGFELTFRHLPVEGDPEKPIWPTNLLENIAKYVFQSGHGFADYHFMSANGPLRMDTDTEITAMAFYTDPELGAMLTPHGRVDFIQIFGITTKEYEHLRDKKYTVQQLLEEHLQVNPLLITDLGRRR